MGIGFNGQHSNAPIDQPTKPSHGGKMFKKSFLLVLSVCFLLGMATKEEVESVKEEEPASAITGQESSPDMEETPLIKPDEEPALYKTEISQVTPQSGIETGHVIAYGHYIKPPYRFEIREDTLLFLNGVRLKPPLTSRVAAEESKRTSEKLGYLRNKYPEYYEHYDKIYDRKEARGLYKRVYKKQGQQAAIDSVYGFYKKDTIIVYDLEIAPKDEGAVEVLLTIKWLDETENGEVEYTPIPNSFDIRIKPKTSPRGSLFETKEEWFDYKKMVMVKTKKSYEKSLKIGHILYFSYNTQIGFRERVFKKIIEILRSADLSFEEKVEELKSFGPTELGAKDMLYNFDPEVWPEIDEEGDLK